MNSLLMELKMSNHLESFLRIAALLMVIASTLLLACDGSSPTEPCPGPFQVAGDVSAPIRTFDPAPQYTEEAREARI